MIKFNRFVSDSPKTPFYLNGIFGSDFYVMILIRILCVIFVNKRRGSKKSTIVIDAKGWWTDGGTGLGLESTTSRIQNYNIFNWDHPEIIKLKSNIIRNFQIYNKECEVDTLPVNCGHKGGLTS